MPLLGTRGAASARGFGLFSSLTTLTTDPYFKYVTMLLHGDGTNGAQNNTFLDSSTNNFTITRNGNTTQGSFSPYGSNWSNYFDAYTKYLTVNAQTALSFGTGDFTIEAWVYVTSISSYAGILETRPGVTGQTYVFGIYNSSGNRLDFYMGPSVTRLTSASTVNLNSWNHVAVSRSGTTVRLFINGVLDANTVTTSASIDANATTQLIGTIRDGDGYNLNGYISNLRVVKGTAVYTSSFIPSTAPLTAISGTSLLTCQSNRFIDNSTNAFAITVNGTPSVQRFSPFSPTAAYSAATVGGSGYFDGSGDYLTVPSNAAWAFGTGDFTIECWVNPSTQGGHGNSNNDCIIDFRPGVNGGAYGTLYIRSSGTGVTWYANGANQINGGAIPNNTWTHVVVSRVSGNTRLFLNGIQSGGTYADSTNYAQGTPWIALFNDTIGSGFFNGYITDMRVVKGSGVTSVTVPTAPLTAITNTQLLLSYTNGGIFDNAMMNNLETVGNAQISTSVVKFGSGSMAFDGSGDRLYQPLNQNFNFGTGDFTIELWVNPINQGGHGSSNNDCLIDFRPGGNGVYGTLYIFNSGTGVYWYVNGANRIAGGAISNGVWTHVALCRASGSTKLFLNGTQSGSTYTDSNNYLVSPIMIGEFNDGTGAGNFNGYIDDLRITKGYARYTANFSVPTSAFPNQ